MIKPPRLRPNALIGLVAPASGPADADQLQRGREMLERLGFRVRLGLHLLDSHGYLAGRDEVRAEDLNEMFADEAVEAIFCIRGGYGASRLLPRLDFAALQAHPKILLGYSDITVLELAILRKVGLVTFYGPMVTTEMAGTFRPEDQERMWAALTQLTPPQPLGAVADGESPNVIRSGNASGPLVGGCLSVLVSLLGTPYEPELDGAILFLEDLDEEPYRLDRYLTQLRLSGKLNRVAGVALGQFVNCEPRKERSSFAVSLSCREVLEDRLLLTAERMGERPLRAWDSSAWHIAFDSRVTPTAVLGRITRQGETGLMQLPLLLHAPGLGTLKVNTESDACVWRSDSIHPIYATTSELKIGEVPQPEGDYLLLSGSHRAEVEMVVETPRVIPVREGAPPEVAQALRRCALTSLTYRPDTATFSNSSNAVHAPLCMDNWSAIATRMGKILPGLRATDLLRDSLERCVGAPGWATSF